MLLVYYNTLYGAKKEPAGMFTAARCHFKWVREGVIVFEGQEDSGGWLSSVCPEHAAHRGTVKYEQVLMNCAADSQFRGPEKLHLRDKKKQQKTSSLFCLSVTPLLPTKD